ncbi:putative ABC-type transport system, permease component [Xenococcus sp. PCC 7305]|uniref:exopolysaccharide biosynthesis protein n=1 Tax=Xenococcus sp. PCC 7305 TaxID=102125 RepID=UPI0002ABC4DA|nr:exopolysaccharide biosynthesis protein [Xenococcus sp. PCC 7305]ELS02037.1 putative ABC-type transport system, permease component [Xenococcus sp. PCC 7305]
MAKLSVELNRYFFEEERDSQVTLEDILSLTEERIFGFLLVILALPSALPIPAPGYSVPFGIAIFFLASQLILGRQRPWLPAKMMKGSMKLETVQGFVKKGLPWLQRVERLTKPRFAYICASLPGRILLGSAIALMSISMMLPIPLTNTIPAIGIFVTAFGLLEDDGLISIFGLFICSVGFTITSSILIFGVTAVRTVIDFIKEYLGNLISYSV